MKIYFFILLVNLIGYQTNKAANSEILSELQQQSRLLQEYNAVVTTVPKTVKDFNVKVLQKDEMYGYENGKYNGNGNGTFHFSNGDIYEGEWKNGKRNGKGIIIYGYGEFKGDKYVGNWLNDKENGKGNHYYANGDKYRGEWKDGFKNGKGIYYYANDPRKGDKYVGDWLNDKENGQGIYYYANGNKYEGEWKDGKKASTTSMAGSEIGIKWKKNPPVSQYFEKISENKWTEYQNGVIFANFTEILFQYPIVILKKDDGVFVKLTENAGYWGIKQNSITNYAGDGKWVISSLRHFIISLTQNLKNNNK